MSTVESARYWLSWLEFGSKLAIFLVVIGVAYEFVEKRFGGPLQKVIDDAKDSQIAAAERAAAESNRIAAEANLEIARLNLEIERMRTPRRLSPTQRQRIASKLKAFPSQKFSLSVGQDTEQLGLLADVKMTLLDSSWIEVEPTGFGDFRIGDAALAFGTGVVPRFAPNATTSTRNAASELADALNVEHVASKPESDVRVTDPTEINVLVGSKPPQ